MDKMTSMERVLAVLSGEQPDRVPLFLLFSFYGAKELNISVKDYFNDIDKIVKTQLLMRNKYGTDCLYAFKYASVEFEAFGGETIFSDHGPPLSGDPIIKKFKDIDSLKTPNINESSSLNKILELTRQLKSKVGNEVPIIGVVMGPYSLPVMQMGFDQYFNLMMNDKLRFSKLMEINKEFCIKWANAQINAGITAIAYFNPVASREITEKNLYMELGFRVDKETIEKIKGPTAIHFGSALTEESLEDFKAFDTSVIAISARESIDQIKKKSDFVILGNLSAINMANWTVSKTIEEVKKVLKDGMKGGRFILSDNHGEIPYEVSEEILLTIKKTVDQYGVY